MESAATKRSFFSYGAARLSALCRSLGFSSEREAEIVEVFRLLLAPWGEEPIGQHPRWPSDITDDHSPFEFSLAMDRGKPELRILVEAQAGQPSLMANWRAARDLNRTLERDFGVALDRLKDIEHLFVPNDPSSKFAMWHAASFGAEGPPTFKVYLNPGADGAENAAGLIENAFARLGFGDALRSLPPVGRRDVIKYFSLDLSSKKEARVKVYLAHYDTTADEIEAVVSVARYHVPGEAARFCCVLGGFEGPYQILPLQTCLAFIQGHPTPVMGTVHFPVRAYSESDASARERIMRYLDEQSGQVYGKAVGGFANRSLDEGLGMQTYASLRQQKGGSRITVYLSPEVHTVEPKRTASASLPAPSRAPRPDQGLGDIEAPPMSVPPMSLPPMSLPPMSVPPMSVGPMSVVPLSVGPLSVGPLPSAGGQNGA